MCLPVENELSVEIAQMSSVAKRRIEKAKAALESKEIMMKGIGSVTKNMQLVVEVIESISEVRTVVLRTTTTILRAILDQRSVKRNCERWQGPVQGTLC